jgi:Fur family peroxide stress response transcriptional regulator
MVNKSALELLAKHGLKITPQRIAILDVILSLKDHPSAETICNYLRLNYPNISISTIYKTLETLSSKGIIKKVYSETDTMRYDAVIENHHHLYCIDTERIEDYYDDNLNKLLNNYLKKKRIPNFTIEDFKLQIIGKFIDIKTRK